MTLQTSGSISLADIANEFGGTAPHSLQEYYRGGSLVPATRGALVPAQSGQAEVQTITATGTRSNVVTSGTDEQVSIRLRDDFDSGPAVGNYPPDGGFAFRFQGSQSFTITSTIDDRGPTATFSNVGGTGTWSDRGIYTNSSSASDDSVRIIRYDGSDPITINRLRTTINIADDNTNSGPSIAVGVDTSEATVRGDSIYSVLTDSNAYFNTFVNTGGSAGEQVDLDVTVSNGTFTVSNGNVIVIRVQGVTNGEVVSWDDLRLELSTSSTSDFTPSVDGPASYQFELDTGGTVFPTTGTTFVPTETRTLVARDTVGNLSTSRWDLRVGQFSSQASVSYTSWSDWNGNWIRFDSGSTSADTAIRESDQIVVAIGSATATLTIADGAASGSTDSVMRVTGIVSSSGTPASTGGISLTGRAPNNTILSGTFSANANATTALTELRTAVLGEWQDNGVTVSTPTTTASVPSTMTIDFTDAVFIGGSGIGNLVFFGETVTTRQEGGFITINAGDTREEVITDYFNEMSNAVSRSTVLPSGFSVTRSGDVITISAPGEQFLAIANTDTSLNGFPEWSTNPVVSITAPASEAAVVTDRAIAPITDDLNPPTAGSSGHSEIIIDTNQTTNINQMLTITANEGENTDIDLEATIDGTPPSGNITLSTYTITDYRSRQITSFTRSVSSTSESDISTVLSTMESAVDTNNETPVNFTAGVSGSVLTLTADSNAPLTDTATPLDISVTFAEPASSGTFNFQITGLVDLETEATRSFITGTQSYTDHEHLRDILVGLIDADPDLEGFDIANDGSNVVLVIQSSTHRLSGTVTLDSSTSITVADRTGRGSGGSGATPNVTSGGAASTTAVLWSATANHGGGGGTISFGTAVQTTAGRYQLPARDTREDINEGIPTTGVLSFQQFYGGTNA